MYRKTFEFPSRVGQETGRLSITSSVGEYKSPRPSKVKGDFAAFSKAKRRGGIVMRPHSREHLRLGELSLHYDYVLQHRLDLKDRRVWQNSGYSTPSDLDWGMTALQRAIQIALSKLERREELITIATAKANQRDADILTMLAELPETIGMFNNIIKGVRKPLTTLVKLSKAKRQWKWDFDYLAYQKLNRKGELVTKYRKQRYKRYFYDGKWLAGGELTSQAWLTYRYGIMPLIYEAQDLIKALGKHEKLFETEKERNVVDISETFDIATLNQPFALTVPVVATVTGKATQRVVIKRRYNVEQLYQKRFGFNPLLTAWELVPLSFVVDWFVQVGDAIQALQPTCYEEEGATYSVALDLDVEIHQGQIPAPYNDSSGFLYSLNNVSIRQKGAIRNYNREVVSTSARYLTLPSKVELNWKRNVDAFALSWPHIRALFERVDSNLFKRKKGH